MLLRYFAVAILIIALGSSMAWSSWEKQQSSAVAPFCPPSTTNSDGKMTLAIMYFDNNLTSKDHDSLDRMRMGIVGALITELSKVQQLTIVEREKVDALRGEIEMQWKGDGFDQQTVQKFGKLLGAQALCFGSFMDTPFSSGSCSMPFYKKSTGEGQMRIDARIVVVETGAILKAEEITGQKRELFKLIKQLGLKVADRLETNLGVKVTPDDKNAINTEDTVYTTLSLVKYEDARDIEQKAQITLEDASKLSDTLKEAKKLKAQRLFDDAERKYEEALTISLDYAEAKKSIERLNQYNNIGILNFDNLTNSPELENYTKAVPDLILATLSKSPKLSFVDRQYIEKIIDNLLLEENLTKLGIMDPKKASKIGSQTKANYMLYGGLSSFKKKNKTQIRITMRLVRIKDVKIVMSDEIKVPPTEYIDDKTKELAQRFLKTLSPVSPKGAAIRSLIPGWGQFASNRPSGYIFLPLSIIAIGGCVYSQHAYVQADKDYDEMLYQEYKTYEDYLNTKEKLDNSRQFRKIAVGILAVVWLANVADAFLEVSNLAKQEQKMENRIQMQTSLEQNKIQVSLTKRF